MISLNRIKFGGVFSNELNMPDLIMDCAFDSENSEASTFLTREAVASESYDGRNRKINYFKYTENFAPKFTFMKNGFEDFTQDEVRALLKYLTSKDTTGLLEAYDDDSNVVSWASIGNFSEIQLYKVANKRVIGVTAVWDSISPFCLSDLYIITQKITSTNNKITIEIDTDDNKPVYPRITIQGNCTGVRFINKHTDFLNQSKAYESTALSDNTADEKIIIDGPNKIITSSRTRRIFGDDFNWQWLELYDGKNEITIDGDCELQLEWREVRKIGEY